MKKQIKFLVLGILLVCLISCVLLIKNINNTHIENTCDNFELSELTNEIILSTDSNFMQDIDADITSFMPVTISNAADYVFFVDEIEGEYFMIGKGFNENELYDLNSFVETNNRLYEDNKIEIETHGKITYVILSKKYTSIIEGIIRSYVYCN